MNFFSDEQQGRVSLLSGFGLHVTQVLLGPVHPTKSGTFLVIYVLVPRGGVVTEGTFGADGVFVVDRALAKHDENYRPKEVADSLKAKGVWREN